MICHGKAMDSGVSGRPIISSSLRPDWTCFLGNSVNGGGGIPDAEKPGAGAFLCFSQRLCVILAFPARNLLRNFFLSSGTYGSRCTLLLDAPCLYIGLPLLTAHLRKINTWRDTSADIRRSNFKLNLQPSLLGIILLCDKE